MLTHTTRGTYVRFIKKINKIMQFLNPEIEALTKRKATQNLVKKEISCGIFQDVKDIPVIKETVVLKKV
jgi:hypothetical protein